MIISHKYKFLFIGLPFSASSAITKDLHAKYEGEPYLRKHSLYHEFIKIATKKEKSYFVFAVLRNPMEIVITTYSKMKANAKGNFTNPELFQENGGHITKFQRVKYNFIKDNNSTFQEYFLKFYTKPYDNLASITLDNCDFIIQYNNIENDYILALEKAGINNPSPLPVANKTAGKEKELSFYYSNEVRGRAISVFGPFMQKYGYKFPDNWGKVRVSKIKIAQFRIISILRKLNEKYIKKRSARKSIPGTIYGEMQRKNKKG
ncbi:hypothetical protein OAJ65_02270 [Flavobacteriales bacterium]|nr:hypothetical protein [Flavobacteriales bacterium]